MLPPLRLTHCIYHVAPMLANPEGWRWNVRQLVRRWGVFTGRKLIAVVSGEGMEPFEAVQREFPADAEWLHRENCPILREVATFEPLLEAIRTTEPDAVFYGHVKGISTRGDREGAKRWSSMMYRALLDNMGLVRAGLKRHPFVGTTVLSWPPGTRPPYPSRLMHGSWMMAGAFFWFRADEIYRRNWRDVPVDRYGAEAWPSGLYPTHHACCSLYQPWSPDTVPKPSPYDPGWYPEAEG